MFEPDDVIAGKRGVDGWYGLGGVDHRFENEVVDGVFVAVGFFRLFVDLLAKRHEWCGVHLKMQIEMRDRGFGSHQARGNDLAHGAEFDDFVVGFCNRKDGLG